MTTSPRQLSFALLAGVLCLGAASAPAAEVRSLGGRWEEIVGRDVRSVFVARGGRVFYERTGGPDDKLTVSAGGMVSPGFTPLLLDRSERLWCLERSAQRIVGVKGDSAVELRPTPGTRFRVPGVRQPFTSAHEDEAGRIWFGNSRGVQWLDGKTWSHKDLADERGLELGEPMLPLNYAEGDGGRVFFWAADTEEGFCGTRGVWSFDGKAWAHHTSRDLLPGDNVRAVCPVGGGAMLVNTAEGRLVTLDLRAGDVADDVDRLVPLLNHEQWAVREKATKDLAALGRRAALDLKQHLTQTPHPEVRSRIKMVLDALASSGAAQQRLPGGRYTCESVRVHAPSRPQRPAAGRTWLAEATNAVDTQTHEARERAVFLLSAGSVRLIGDWPARRGAAFFTTLPDGKGGLWIGIAGRGLFHWNGTKTERLSTLTARGYWRILGRDESGRLLVAAGSRIARYRPPGTAGRGR